MNFIAINSKLRDANLDMRELEEEFKKLENDRVYLTQELFSVQLEALLVVNEIEEANPDYEIVDELPGLREINRLLDPDLYRSSRFKNWQNQRLSKLILSKIKNIEKEEITELVKSKLHYYVMFATVTEFAKAIKRLEKLQSLGDSFEEFERNLRTILITNYGFEESFGKMIEDDKKGSLH